jgi:hypothetical protein
MTSKGRVPFLSIGVVALMVYLTLDQPAYPGSRLFYAAFILFFVGEVVKIWLLSRRASHPATPAILPVREWQVLAVGHGISALLVVVAGLCGLGAWWSLAGASIYALAGLHCVVRARRAAENVVAA